MVVILLSFCIQYSEMDVEFNNAWMGLEVMCEF
jgi:hypothetical protein